MRLLKESIIISAVIMIGVFNGCDRRSIPTESDSSLVQTFPEMENMEKVLADLAVLLPEAMADPNLAEIIWNEANANKNDEPYALWSKIADIPTPSGITLRSRIQQIRLSRTMGKTMADVQAFTTSLDSVEYLQVYIHDFEDWDGTEAIPATFVPLTIDDIDVTELILFNSTGNQTLLELNNVEPEYPIVVVGLYEGPHNANISINKTATARTEIMDKMYLIGYSEGFGQ